MKAVRDPLPYIPDHVIMTETVWREGPNRSRLLVIPFAAAAIAVGAILAGLVTPWISSLRTGPSDVFIFRFGELVSRATGSGRLRVAPPAAPPWLSAPCSRSDISGWRDGVLYPLARGRRRRRRRLGRGASRPAD